MIGLLETLNVGALIVSGGNGSLAGAACLAAESDLRVIGVPASIKGGLPMTDMALGTDTALNTLADAAGQLAETSAGHLRVTVFEALSVHSGGLARMAGLAIGAEVVVASEQRPLTEARMKVIAERLEQAMHRGRRHGIVLVSAGASLEPPRPDLAGPASRLTRYLKSYFQRERSPFPRLETDLCVLGPLERGAVPSAADRILAARFAEAAWQAIANGNERSGVLGLHAGCVLLHDFEAGADSERIETGRSLGRLQKDMVAWSS